MKRIAIVIVMLSAAANAQKWAHGVVKDEMTDRKSFVAYTTSLIPGTRNTADLGISCPVGEEARKDVVDLTPGPHMQKVLITIDMHTMVSEPAEDGLLVRFDQDEAGYIDFVRTISGHGFLAVKGEALLNDYLLGAKTFKVEFIEYPHHLRVVTFNLVGLSAAIKGHCGQ